MVITAIGEAIDMSEKLDGARVVDTSEVCIEEVLDYRTVREKAFALWNQLIEHDPDNAGTILKKAEIIFGRPIRLSEITEDQVDLFNLVVLEMQDML